MAAGPDSNRPPHILLLMNASSDPGQTKRSPPKGPLIAAFAVLAVGLSLYGMTRLKSNDGGACQAAGPLLKRLEPLAKGEIAALQVPKVSRRIEGLSFTGNTGSPLKIADFAGKTVLLNLWATWCAPCKAEMPALDALQKELGGARFEVVAVNIDTRNLDKPREWLKDANINDLAYYADPSATIFQDLKRIGRALGMPTTLLIDPEGCELAYLAGPAEWASGDAKSFIRAALGR